MPLDEGRLPWRQPGLPFPVGGWREVADDEMQQVVLGGSGSKAEGEGQRKSGEEKSFFLGLRGIG